MLHTYCLDTGHKLDEGITCLLFAIHEMVQKPLGFIPAELMFGHTVQGPLKLFQENLSSEEPTVKSYVRDCEIIS